MSSSQTSEHAFDMFTDSTYFDEDTLLSADVPLPSIECTEDLSADLFDSAFEIGFDNESLHSDMSVWPVDGLLECSDDLTSSPSRVADLVPNSSSPTSSGTIENLWRPLIVSDTINVAFPDTPTPSRAPAKHRAPKAKTSMAVKTTQKPSVTKAKKITKPGKAHKRTVSAPSSEPRSVQTLYTLPWSHLSQEEKGLLLLPLLQGIDPNTGEKIGEAGSLLPPPSFEMVTDDVFGTGDDGTNFMDNPSPLSTSSSAATTTVDLTGDDLDLSDKDIAMFRACQAFNIQHEAQKKIALPTLSDFNFDMPDFEFDETNWDIFDNFMAATQGIGGPTSSDVIGNSIRKVTTVNDDGNTGRASNLPEMTSTGLGQMPVPSGDYGRKRQQEALGRNAMLRAAGRRR
ncbi:hypothetical protein GT037_009179 [Alternaria burnsii]|uniref:Uncharacterized protein n=1 Tax=Alternaria burnsii TaxID=1187904 RepID=A0A8H7EBR3_9PLEO|nr:uncharacterized protein GT037_009179 [Alternaria burnsii]KAF7672678.1 hypothetical protein GT037_009179 [Alternaria burnsii]CAI9627583.1 unnamed protein product [Alternaria burnsii]